MSRWYASPTTLHQSIHLTASISDLLIASLHFSVSTQFSLFGWKVSIKFLAWYLGSAPSVDATLLAWASLFHSTVVYIGLTSRSAILSVKGVDHFPVDDGLRLQKSFVC